MGRHHAIHASRNKPPVRTHEDGGGKRATAGGDIFSRQAEHKTHAFLGQGQARRGGIGPDEKFWQFDMQCGIHRAASYHRDAMIAAASLLQ